MAKVPWSQDNMFEHPLADGFDCLLYVGVSIIGSNLILLSSNYNRQREFGHGSGRFTPNCDPIVLINQTWTVGGHACWHFHTLLVGYPVLMWHVLTSHCFRFVSGFTSLQRKLTAKQILSILQGTKPTGDWQGFSCKVMGHYDQAGVIWIIIIPNSPIARKTSVCLQISCNKSVSYLDTTAISIWLATVNCFLSSYI